MSRASREPWRIGLAFLLALTLNASPPPVSIQAHNDIFGWWNCNWEYKQGLVLPSRNVRVRQDGSFPADSWGDGVKNSFIDRMRDGVARWNAVFNNYGSASDVVWVDSGSTSR